MSQTKISVIVPAAGIGTRFKSNMPKQYSGLGGTTVLEQTVNSFTSHEAIREVILAISESDSIFQNLIFENHEKIKVVSGGQSRQDSVNNCFVAVDKDTNYVIVHDSVRPFFSIETALNQIQHLKEFDGAVPVIGIPDSLRSGEGMKPVDRSSIFAVQTPQIFKKSSLQDAFSKKIEDNLDFTDESQLLEAYGYKIKFFEGEPANKKITYPSDLYSMPSMDHRFGRGIDYHLYKPGSGFFLGGVQIDSNYEIVSHSDGDVLLHALADSIFGAIGLRDIGFYFPDSDPLNKNLDSKIILNKALELLKNKNVKLNQIDITIVCGVPKISPYVDAIKESLSILCNVASENISIKSTTTEGLGGIGHDKGIAVFALVSVFK
jgi:2-C-methyl-D-erythritol 4-phosphate cytidylyltransferase/2-C-methyl-D-erythritol 2,4-cyclodiphosphate synthase